LNFADFDETTEPQKSETHDAAGLTIDTEIDEALPTVSEEEVLESKKCVDAPQPFNVADIPSPTRNRAKRQAALLAAATKNKDEEQQPVVEIPAEQPMAEIPVGANEVEKTFISDEQAQWAESRRLQEAEEMAAMDKICVENFLDSVKKVSWRAKPRTPIKGTNLYTKHMRPCRPVGTSVDVKDSNFRSLGFLLQFLESEGLLSLQPGLSDPVVTRINFEACAKYKYTSQFTPVIIAPHESGCCCRKCTNAVHLECSPGFQWQ
jgi:hypothetical protein